MESYRPRRDDLAMSGSYLHFRDGRLAGYSVPLRTVVLCALAAVAVLWTLGWQAAAILGVLLAVWIKVAKRNARLDAHEAEVADEARTAQFLAENERLRREINGL